MSSSHMTVDEDEEYGEDDFEFDDDEPGSVKSPLRRLSVAETERANNGNADRAETTKPSDNSSLYPGSLDITPSFESAAQLADEEDEDLKFDEEEDVDLERYMSKMPLQEEKARDDPLAREIKPTEALQQQENDAEQGRLRDRLGLALQTARALSSSMKGDAERSPSPILSSPPMSSKKSQRESEKEKEKEEEDEEDQAAKVDNLLMELFPERYSNIKKKGSGKEKEKEKEKEKPKKPAKQQYGLAAPRVREERDEEPSTVQARDVLSTLDAQLKLLKKELKVKDDKIARLMDHSAMLANQLDRYKGEVARLNAKLHESALELEAKDARLAEALKAKKKAAKKASQSTHASPNTKEKGTAEMEGEILRLRDREQALLEAVEELSSQNEDLIMKLRESMQRELELSSKRAALISNSVARGFESCLPSIHEKESGAHSHRSSGDVEHSHKYADPPRRSQSEPAIDVPPKRGKKKKAH